MRSPGFSIGRVLIALPLLTSAWLALPLAAAAQEGAAEQVRLEPTSCVTCHGDAELWDADEIAVIERYRSDVHAEVGLSCHNCHGGNPDPELFEDMSGAMDEGFVGNPYRGAPEPSMTPEFCGSCHSNAAYMRRFRPDIRVDQVAEYWTSQHGIALAAGDTNVATCVSCHGNHGIRRPTDTRSSVHPTRVAVTCSQCHADAERMAGYTLPNGRALPVDQFARWQQSVHADALIEREDLFAPSCNDCHGNHGAAPPGVDSVSFVCGQCHGREATIFRSSDKHEGFITHNEYLADAGSEGCAACHVDPEPQAAITNIREMSECATCHGNHGIVRPSLSMLSPLPETPCYFCHEGASAAVTEMHAEDDVNHFQVRREALLAEAAGLGLEGDERFDWLVDQALGLPDHWAGRETDSTEGTEFRVLFDKFRIGKTAYTYVDPASGEPVRATVRRCASCHASTELLGEDARGYTVSATMLDAMSQLTAMTAEAERSLLRARRGGVETRSALDSVEEAVNSQIELEVLLHTFAAGTDGDFLIKHAEGMMAAQGGIEAGQGALTELSSRRLGLMVALALIVVFIVALALKIRDISSERQAEPGSAG